MNKKKTKNYTLNARFLCIIGDASITKAYCKFYKREFQTQIKRVKGERLVAVVWFDMQQKQQQIVSQSVSNMPH